MAQSYRTQTAQPYSIITRNLVWLFQHRTAHLQPRNPTEPDHRTRISGTASSTRHRFLVPVPIRPGKVTTGDLTRVGTAIRKAAPNSCSKTAGSESGCFKTAKTGYGTETLSFRTLNVLGNAFENKVDCSNLKSNSKGHVTCHTHYLKGPGPGLGCSLGEVVCLFIPLFQTVVSQQPLSKWLC